MKILLAFSFLCIVLLIGCIQIANVKIRVVKYQGNCLQPVSKIPCCEAFPQENFLLTIDDQNYSTNKNGEVLLNLEENKTYVIEFQGCEKKEALEIFVTKKGAIYEKTVVYGNGASIKENVTDWKIEINLACCLT